MKLAIRTKLTLWYIGTVVALLAIFVGADVVGLRSNLLRRADARLLEAKQALVGSISRERVDWHRAAPNLAHGKGLLQQKLGAEQAWGLLVLEQPGRPAVSLLTFASASAGGVTPDWDRCAAAGDDEAFADQQLPAVGSVRCLSAAETNAAGNRYVVKIAVSVESSMATWRHALWEHGVLMIILVVLVSVVGTVFIRRVFRPVRRMVQIAQAITADDLSLRVNDLGDRDEIGELARTLNDMIAGLERSFSQVQRFSSDASHELNTPLTVLRGELEVALRRDRSPDEYRELLQRLQREVNRLAGIVDDLLFISRADAHNLEVASEAVALHRIVLEAFEDASALATDRGVELELERVDEVTVRGDGSHFKRAVMNILDNAIKFTPSDGSVAVSLEDLTDRATLSVADTGCGIAAADRERIFDRFYRAEPSRSKRTGGVGLGLSLVREIADLYGLDLHIETEVGEGTRFVVTWLQA